MDEHCLGDSADDDRSVSPGCMLLSIAQHKTTSNRTAYTLARYQFGKKDKSNMERTMID